MKFRRKDREANLIKGRALLEQTAPVDRLCILGIRRDEIAATYANDEGRIMDVMICNDETAELIVWTLQETGVPNCHPEQMTTTFALPYNFSK